MNKPVRVILTGDISGARDIADEASKRSAPGYMFQHVKGLLQGSDVAFGNFECAVPCRTGKVVLVAPETFPQAVADAGFDIVSLANNHSFDAGEEGFHNTTRLLKRCGVDVIGGSGGHPVIKNIRGVKLGFQACVDPEWSPSYKHPTKFCADFLKGLRQLRPKVDALFVSVHWGKEYDEATPRQKKIAKLLLEAGADVVIGHHPHVPQEVMVTKKGQWVFYSLGNFVFDSHVGGSKTKRGFAVSLDVTPEGITNVKKIPYALGDPTPEGTPYCAPSWVSSKKVAARYLTAAKGMRDLPPDWSFVIGSVSSSSSDIRLMKGKKEIGHINFRRNSSCGGAYEIWNVSAPSGWGPFMYDLVMELAGNAGIMPDRGSITPAAKAVWEYYLRKRNNKDVVALSIPEEAGGDNCEMWEDRGESNEPLDFVYKMKGRPTKIPYLKAKGQWFTESGFRQVAARYLKTAVKVEVNRKFTTKGNIVGRFLSSIPLYRAMDGEELKKVLDTGEIKGGEYSTPFESRWGAQWTASKSAAFSFGINQAGKRLGHEIFIAETNGRGQVFGHLSTKPEEWDFDGSKEINKSFCNTGLGCSIQTRIQDVKNWYQIKNGKPVKVSLGELKALAPSLGLKPRDLMLFKGGLIHPSAKLKKALQIQTVIAQYPSDLDNIPGNSKQRHLAIRDLGGYKRITNQEILRELCEKSCNEDWTTSGAQAERDANKGRADNINTFAVIASIDAIAAAPNFQVDFEKGSEVKMRSLQMWVPHVRKLKNDYSTWKSVDYQGSDALRLAARYIAKTNTPSKLGLLALEIAIENIGRGEEGGNNLGPFIEMVHGNPDPDDPEGQASREGPWCSSFVSWCFEKACKQLGVEMPFKRAGTAKRLWKNIKNVGSEPKKPLPGDVVCWDRQEEDSWQGHIGFVEKVEGNTLHTVEGNVPPEEVGSWPSKVKRFQHDLTKQDTGECHSDMSVCDLEGFGRAPALSDLKPER
jgi:gamma-polyglutamate biosynthesis protein CapA